MSARGGRLATGFVFVLVISVVLFCAPVNDDVGRFFIGILAIGAVAAVALAMQAEIHERQTTENAGRFENPSGPVPARSPSIAFSPQPSHGPRPPSYHLEFEPPSLSVPRFGKGSRTQREPWRLPAQPTQVPGIMADEAVLGELTVRAASLVGPGHRSAEPATVRQDAYRLGRDAAGDYLVIAVADGVSNSRRSDLGAAVAVSSAVSSAVELLRSGFAPTTQWAPTLFAATAKRIREEAAGRGLSDDDVCAVLITAILPARLREGGPQHAWVGWLGDVSLWELGEGYWRPAAGDNKRDEGGMASNALSAVLPRSPEFAQSSLVPLMPGSVLTFVTDGVGDGLAGLPDLNKLLASRWASPPPIADFINHVGYDAEQFLDDRSAVTVWVGPQARRPRSPSPRLAAHARPPR
jgi:hypothetical protein